jgi:hypothetical protein
MSGTGGEGVNSLGIKLVTILNLKLLLNLRFHHYFITSVDM